MHRTPKSKPKPKPKEGRHKKPGPDSPYEIMHETRKLVRGIPKQLAHLEDLLVALGSQHGNSEKIQAILDKLDRSKAKLKAALEAKPPASIESGDPPQGETPA